MPTTVEEYQKLIAEGKTLSFAISATDAAQVIALHLNDGNVLTTEALHNTASSMMQMADNGSSVHFTLVGREPYKEGAMKFGEKPTEEVFEAVDSADTADYKTGE